MSFYIVHLRHTGSDGRKYVQEHTAWDRGLFLASQQDYIDRANEDVIKKGGIGLAKVEVITEVEYREERW